MAPANETRVLLQTLTTLRTRRERAFETSDLSVETEKLAVGYNETGRALYFVLECGVCCNDIHLARDTAVFTRNPQSRSRITVGQPSADYEWVDLP